jgi:hypothetical protein
MIVFASGQAWKLWLPMAGAAVLGGLLMWLRLELVFVLALLSLIFVPLWLWSLYSVGCPRCGDRWLWNQATKGTTPSLEPVVHFETCPRCGLSAAEMQVSRANF